MGETRLVKLVQVALSKMGAKIFRNNVGVLKDIRNQYVTYGLCPGSSDLIGWMPDGRFLAVEVKAPGARTEQKRFLLQKAFLDAVRKDGGVAFMVDSVELAISLYRGHLGNSTKL